VLLPLAGECMFCPRAEHQPATNQYADRFGYVYLLCPRHYEPLRQWKERLRQRERKRQSGRGILKASDFVRQG
jgi:histone acetyltransferase (RNA polymerase elongator complex component)